MGVMGGCVNWYTVLRGCGVLVVVVVVVVVAPEP